MIFFASTIFVSDCLKVSMHCFDWGKGGEILYYFHFLLVDFELTSSCNFEIVLGSFTDFSKMQSIKQSILSHVNLRRSTERWFLAKDNNVLMHLRCWCSSTGASSDLILDRVIRLVKKYDKIDAAKVFKYWSKINFSLFFYMAIFISVGQSMILFSLFKCVD